MKCHRTLLEALRRAVATYFLFHHPTVMAQKRTAEARTHLLLSA
jgi:hypothetical protein